MIILLGSRFFIRSDDLYKKSSSSLEFTPAPSRVYPRPRVHCRGFDMRRVARVRLQLTC